MNPTFKLEHKDNLTKARACKIKTSHGEINTPIFMPVGTQGTQLPKVYLSIPCLPFW